MDQDNYQDAFQMRSFLNQGATTNINDTPTNNSSINSFVTATNGDSRIFYNRGPSTPLLPAVLQNLTNQTEAQRNPYGPNYNTTAQDRNLLGIEGDLPPIPLWTQIQKQKLNYQQGPHRRHISLHIYT